MRKSLPQFTLLYTKTTLYFTALFFVVIFGIVIVAGIPHIAFAVTCGFGSEVGATGMCRGFIIATTTTTWSVPSDWNNASNTIEVIGGGGAGSIGASGIDTDVVGGGGGAYAKKVNATLSPGGTIGANVGDGGWTQESGDDTWLCNSTSNCASIAGSAVIVGAKGGGFNTDSSGSLGGQASASVGDVKYNGGNGNDATPFGGAGGGGGAAGPLGAGGNGGDGGSDGDGAGGGGNGGGSNGVDATASNSGAGGNNAGGSGGGSAGGGFGNAGDGTDGGGGGGMDYIGLTAGDGGNGTEWVSHGSGGGGGGGGGAGQIEPYNTCYGGNGGLYGGGGGGCAGTGSRNSLDFHGAQGIIVISYNPATPATRSSLSRPANNLGLVAYFPFNEGTSFSTGDFSGKGYVGTLSGSTVKPAWVFGKFGKALQFVTGTDNYVTVPAPDTDFLGPLSISSWVKFTSNGGAIAGKLTANGGTNNAFDFQVGGNGLYFVRANTNYCAFFTADNIIVPNTWHHVAVTTSSGDITTNPIFYIDGVVATTLPGSCPGSGSATGVGNPIRIGRRDDGDAQAEGIIDELRIYNRELSSTEIKALAKTKAALIGGSEKSKITNGLIGYWSFNGNDMNWTGATAGTAYDRSGQGINGTLTGMDQQMSVVSGKLGQALNFDGVDDYIDFGNIATYDFQDKFSIAAWFKASALSGGPAGACGYQYPIISNYDYGWQVYLANDNKMKLQKCSAIACTSYYYESTGTFEVNRWYQIAVVQRASALELYINGVYDGQVSVSDLNAYYSGTDSPFIGKSKCGGVVHYFNGAIDDVRIYNRDISASEIKQIYTNGSGAIIRNN